MLAAAALSNLGDGIRLVALPLLAATLTRDPALVGGLTACAYLPWVLFGLPIGALVDRGRPEVFMAVANVGRAVLLGLLTVALLADAGSMVALYVVAFLLGVGEAAYDNAAQSLVPKIVPDGRLEAANSGLVTAERVGQDLVGPAVGGMLFAAAMTVPFGLNAVTLALAAALLAGIRTARPATPPRDAVIRDAVVRNAVVRDALEGMRWLVRPHLVRTVVLLGCVLNFMTLAWESTLVLLAVGPMRLSDGGFGVMLAAGAVGGVAGAVVTPALVRRFDRRWLQVASLALCAVVDLLLAAFPTPVMGALAWGGTGAGFAVWNVLSVTLRQREVPPELLGRVNSASRTLSMAAAPLGALAGGALAAGAGLRAPLWIAGVTLAVLAGAFALSVRSA
ncbi:MFS transporter [Nonomuraea rhizosphaerae]|uniref:MFS transporter n=1 Tax=Nonomuraea rhizosphaerae TaxID=2665663 RepID=UPI001C5EA633|nr:MFS transporter [Nonomuraea rhizosphaerae]